jgi:hypothetical protein
VSRILMNPDEPIAPPRWIGQIFLHPATWIAASVVVIALAVFNWVEVRRLVDSAAIVLHTHEVQGGTVKLFSLVQDVESDQRGIPGHRQCGYAAAL